LGEEKEKRRVEEEEGKEGKETGYLCAGWQPAAASETK
jgi:hypothetical protein